MVPFPGFYWSWAIYTLDLKQKIFVFATACRDASPYRKGSGLDLVM